MVSTKISLVASGVCLTAVQSDASLESEESEHHFV
jgi:hypothetical protein